MNPFAIPDTPGGRRRPSTRTAKARARAWPRPQPVDDVDGVGGPLAWSKEAARLVLSYPPALLSPNARVHHHELARVKAAYRRACWADAWGQLGIVGCTALGSGDAPIHVHLDFFPPNTRPRDDDNAEAAFKAGRDGLADALKCDDRRFVVTKTLHRAARSCVVVTIAGGNER